MIHDIRQTGRSEIRIAGLAAVVFAALATATPAAVVDLKPRAIPENTVVRLGDVADVSAENGQEAARLAALPLMPAPTGGARRYLRMREVQDLLAAHGEDMSRLNFRGETVTEVASPAAADQPAVDDKAIVREQRRAAWQGTAEAGSGEHGAWSQNQDMDSAGSQFRAPDSTRLRDQLRQIIVEHLTRQAGQGGPWQVELSVPGRYLELLPSATARPTCEGGQSPWTGRQRFLISFPTAGEHTKFAVTAEVSRPQPVVVAVRPIERGAVLTASHVELEQRDNVPPVSGRRAPVGTVESLLGQEAARTIQPGQMIFEDDVRAPLLVKRGEDVAIYARSGGIQVRTTARARQEGARGELIQVESLDTRERYDAVVVGPREAVVFAGSSAPTANVAGRPSQSSAR